MPENLRPKKTIVALIGSGSVSNGTAIVQIGSNGNVMVASGGSYALGYVEYDI